MEKKQAGPNYFEKNKSRLDLLMKGNQEGTWRGTLKTRSSPSFASPPSPDSSSPTSPFSSIPNLLVAMDRLSDKEVEEFLVERWREKEKGKGKGRFDVDERHDVYGWTSLHLAARDGRVSVAKQLLKYSPLLDSRDVVGQTPLHRACQWGRFNMVELLLSAGADFTAIDHLFQTPLQMAEMNGHSKVAQLIQKALSSLHRDPSQLPSSYTSAQILRMRSQVKQKEKEDLERKSYLDLLYKSQEKADLKREKLKRKEFLLKEELAHLTLEIERLERDLSSSHEELSHTRPSSRTSFSSSLSSSSLVRFLGDKVKRDTFRLSKLVAREQKVEKKLTKVREELGVVKRDGMIHAPSAERGDAWLAYLSA